MDSCVLCEFNKIGQCIDETSGWFVDQPSDFKFPGLFFIRLKRHAESLGDLTTEESGEIGGLIKKYSKKSQMISNAQRVLAMSLGLSDPHIHFWIMPKTEENEADVLKIRDAMRQIMGKYRI